MKILEDNNYLIEIRKCHNGITMTLPERKISPHSTEFTKQYIINKGQLFSNDVNMPDLPQVLKPVDVPAYAAKSAIHVDILQHCKIFNYNPDTIKVGDKYGLEEMHNILPELEEATEVKSKVLLNFLFNNKLCEENSEMSAKDFGIEEGYMKLKPHLEQM